MAYNILFKKGSHADFKTNVLTNNNAEAGTLYFTEDEGGLYLGKSGGTVQRIQGVVQYYANLSQFKSEVTPPYSADIIYYIADQNALVKWNGEQVAEDGTIKDGKFTVLNVTAAEMATEVAAREALAERVTTAEGTIAGYTTTIGGIQESITTINGNIETINGNITEITKDDGTIDTKVAASAQALTAEIDKKVDTETYNAFTAGQETAWNANTEAHNTMTQAIEANAEAIEGHTDEISDIKETLSALTGGEGADGTIAGMIEGAVSAEAALREAADTALDGRISGLATELSGYKETVSGTYATKEELTAHASAAANAYATKEELTSHANIAASTYATQTALAAVSDVADAAAAAAQTNANNISTLSSTVSSTYATKEELTSHINTAASTYETIANVATAKEELTQAITDEANRAAEAESGLQTSINGIDQRVATLETWFEAAEDEDGTIESLTELLNYLEAHKGEATDMAGDIQTNAEAIEVLEDYVGVPASGSGETAVAATGLHLAVNTVANDLASEITNRTNAVTNAISTCNQYTDAALTWGSFTTTTSSN